MKILRAFKTELDLNNKQRTILAKHELNALKKTDFPWMYEVSKCAPQEALRNLDKAFANFFRRVALKRGSATALSYKKAGKFSGESGCTTAFSGKVGFPKFKSRRRGLTPVKNFIWK